MEYTIVIPVYNKQGYLERCINSALNQSITPTSILIIDDASTDNSINEIRPFLKNRRIKLIEMENNVGTAKILNKALEFINTPYFLQLDGDDWLEPNAAEELVTAIHLNPKVGFAYGDHYFYWYNQKSEFMSVESIQSPEFQNKYDMMLKLGYMVNPRCFRTESIKAIGGWITNYPFDLWKGRYFEDVQIILRLANKYSWVHVNKFLHNITMNLQTSHHDGKISLNMFNHLRISMYTYLLKEWGNEYRPIWKKAPTGRYILKDLVPRKYLRG